MFWNNLYAMHYYLDLYDVIIDNQLNILYLCVSRQLWPRFKVSAIVYINTPSQAKDNESITLP